jgi:rhamnosyltransferase subunit B
MAKVLLGWEYGSGFGHVGKLLVLARALQDAGHVPAIAIADLDGTRPLWEGKGIEIIPAPGFKSDPNRKRVHQVTFADILMSTGYMTLDRLTRLGRAWRAVFAQVAPDLVICDLAPNLTLQTRGRIPTLAVGTGFAIPPRGRPFPRLRFWESGAPPAASQENEKSVHEFYNAVAQPLGLGPVEFVADLFCGDEAFVCCLPELDCYGALRASPAIGSLDPPQLPSEETVRTGLFAYLVAGEDTALWLDGISASGLSADVFVRGGEGLRTTAGNVVIHEKPVDLSSVLPAKQLLVHHGGMSTTERAMRLGVPQLVIPRTLEQRINGMLVSKQGAGEVVELGPARTPKAFAMRISKATRDRKMAAAANGVARAIADRRAPSALEVVLSACGKYL